MRVLKIKNSIQSLPCLFWTLAYCQWEAKRWAKTHLTVLFASIHKLSNQRPWESMEITYNSPNSPEMGHIKFYGHSMLGYLINLWHRGITKLWTNNSSPSELAISNLASQLLLNYIVINNTLLNQPCVTCVKTNSKNCETKMSPLMVAITLKHQGLIDFLIALGADASSFNIKKFARIRRVSLPKQKIMQVDQRHRLRIKSLRKVLKAHPELRPFHLWDTKVTKYFQAWGLQKHLQRRIFIYFNPTLCPQYSLDLTVLPPRTAHSLSAQTHQKKQKHTQKMHPIQSPAAMAPGPSHSTT